MPAICAASFMTSTSRRRPDTRGSPGPRARLPGRPWSGRSSTCPWLWIYPRRESGVECPPIPGNTPSLISGWPKRALSAHTITSHIMASSQPPPSAWPATAAIIGLRHFDTRSQLSARNDPTCTCRRKSSPPSPQMSAPAAKALSLPVTTITPMASSASNAINGVGELRHHVVAEGVEHLRAIQGHDRDRVVEPTCECFRSSSSGLSSSRLSRSAHHKRHPAADARAHHLRR